MTETACDADSRPTLVEKRLYVGGMETWQQWRTGYALTGQTWWEKDPQGDTILHLMTHDR